MGSGNAEIGQQVGEGLAAHDAAAIAMKQQLSGRDVMLGDPLEALL